MKFRVQRNLNKMNRWKKPTKSVFHFKYIQVKSIGQRYTSLFDKKKEKKTSKYSLIALVDSQGQIL